MLNYAIFSGLLIIVLPGFEGEKSFLCCVTGNVNVNHNKTSILKQNS